MISAVILAKNEEKNIKKCLSTVSWCDEMIVIDDESTDKTVEIARKMGAKVYIRHLDDFSEQRNFGLKKAKGAWILFIDADEVISRILWYEIMEHINQPDNETNGYYLKRVDVIWGRELKHGETGDKKFLRLARKDTGRWEGKVHEKWIIKGDIVSLNNPLYHYPHQSVEEFLKEINYYTDLRAQELFENNKKADLTSILLYPLSKFIQNYFCKLGFLDGLPGLIISLIMSFHSFLVRGKLWQKTLKK